MQKSHGEFLSGTEQDILALRAEVNKYRKRDMKWGRTHNTKTNYCNVNKKKKTSKDKIGNIYDYTVEGITKWKLEPKGENTGDTMVCNGNTYYWCPNHHDRGMWVCHKPDKFNVKGNRVKEKYFE